MIDIENFYEAKSVEDAITQLSHDEKAELISGGTDVLVKIRSGRGEGMSLVSIHEIPELKGVDMLLDGTVVIGPATVFSSLEKDPVIVKNFPELGEAAGTVGGPQIRNMGTVGGNICNGATSADTGSVMQTLNAVLVLQGPDGTREIPVTSFYTGPGRTVRAREEILTAILVKPEDYIGFSGCYMKYGKRRAMEIATLGCSVRVRLTNDSTGACVLGDVRIGLGVAAPTPIRCRETEAALKGKRADDPEIYRLIRAGVLNEVNPRSSWRASREFRLALISELSARALRQAILRGRGEGEPGAGYFPPVEEGQDPREVPGA